MTPNRHGSARVEFPNELEVLITREFGAPIALVFDVLTKPEHVSKWGATPPDQMTECSIDLHVGGNYHYSFVTEDGTMCSFSGTYLEVEPPFRTVETWLFDGWPDAEAVETWQLHETDGETTVTMGLAFRDKAGRDHYPARPQDAGEMTSSGGFLDSLDAGPGTVTAGQIRPLVDRNCGSNISRFTQPDQNHALNVRHRPLAPWPRAAPAHAVNAMY